MESIFLPVEVVCFACYRPNRINCASFRRYCRQCVHLYLQLDRPVYQRELTKRCLTCLRTCTPRFLTPSTAYRYDFLMMQSDAHHFPCPLCHHVVGTQIQIAQHIEQLCPSVIIVCECGDAIAQSHLSMHHQECIRYMRCPFCHRAIAKRMIQTHIEKDHHYRLCESCHSFVMDRYFHRHQSHVCPQRSILCRVCGTSVRVSHVVAHYEDHQRHVQQEILAIRSQLLQRMRDLLLMRHYSRWDSPRPFGPPELE